MKYWPTDVSGEYIREDGLLLPISIILKKDLSPQIIYDEDIQMPKVVYRTMESMMIGSPR